MAGINEGNKVEGVFGGVNLEGIDNQNNNQNNFENVNGANNGNENNGTVFTRVENNNLPIKPSIWSRIKSVLFKEIDLNAPIKVELTPYQQKIEDEINEFLHQEVSFKGFFNLFKSEK